MMSNKTDTNSVSKELNDVASKLITLSCENSDYLKDIESKSYKEIITRINPLVTKESASTFEKLLWTFCQAEKGGLPYSTLYSSVDKSLKDSNLSDQEKKASSATLLKVASALIPNNQLKLATLCGKQTYSVIDDNQDIFSAEVKSKAKNSILHLFDMEIEKARERKEKNSYIDNIQELKTKLEKTKWATSGLKKEEETTDIEAKEEVETITKSSTTIEKNKEGSNYLTIISILSFLLIGYFSYNDVINYLSPVDQVDQASFLMPKTTAYAMSMDLPELSNNTFLNIPSKLTSLESISKVIDKIDNSNASYKDNTSSENKDDIKKIEKEIKESQRLYKEEKNPTKKEDNYGDVTDFISKNVSKKPSSDDLARIDGNNSNNHDDDGLASIDEGKNGLLNSTSGSRNVPNINPKIMENIQVKDIGESHKVETHTSSVVISSDGKKYGDSNKQRKIPEFQVEIFRPARKYVTKTKAVVRTSPTSVGSIKDKLNKDTYLFVVAKIGGWLEVRKKNGERGYILEKQTKHVGVFK